MIVDVNVHLGRWPFRYLRYDDPARLVRKLRSSGVAQAWAGNFDALLHVDLDAVNANTAAWCRRWGQGLLVPFGSVNPMLPDWQTTLRRCVERYRMPGLRLYPGYHGYRLDHEAVAELFRLAQQQRLLLQIAVRLEDPRTQHPLLRVPDVSLTPLQGLMKAFPKVPVVLLGALRSVAARELETMMDWGPLYVELSMLEGVAGVQRLVERVPVERVLFGSHTPLFVIESALLKLMESELTGPQRDTITHLAARKLLPPKTQERSGEPAR